MVRNRHQPESVAAVQLAAEIGLRKAAGLTGIPYTTLQNWVKVHQQSPPEKPFEVDDPLPASLRPVEALLEERKSKYSHLDTANKARELINVKVKIDGPIAISHFGDPHVDDDGTDISLVERHADIINATEGMFGANIGDTMNNWMGRLARLYSEQSTSAKEAWQIGEWFIKKVRWLYFLDGNHGSWSGDGDPVRWMLRNAQGVHGKTQARLNLIFPNGKQVRVNARHDFRGHSMWSVVHGAVKAATMGWRDHILICGHIHASGYQVIKDPSSGLISHAIRIASYKTWDRYAEELGLPNQNIFSNVVTIIDPYATSEVGLVHVVMDVEEGADYLKWKRKRWSKGK